MFELATRTYITRDVFNGHSLSAVDESAASHNAFPLPTGNTSSPILEEDESLEDSENQEEARRDDESSEDGKPGDDKNIIM